jgi:hypothetical protein
MLKIQVGVEKDVTAHAYVGTMNLDTNLATRQPYKTKKWYTTPNRENSYSRNHTFNLHRCGRYGCI